MMLGKPASGVEPEIVSQMLGPVALGVAAWGDVILVSETDGGQRCVELGRWPDQAIGVTVGAGVAVGRGVAGGRVVSVGARGVDERSACRIAINSLRDRAAIVAPPIVRSSSVPASRHRVCIASPRVFATSWIGYGARMRGQ